MEPKLATQANRSRYSRHADNFLAPQGTGSYIEGLFLIPGVFVPEILF
jgi:hypothetical protein